MDESEYLVDLRVGMVVRYERTEKVKMAVFNSGVVTVAFGIVISVVSVLLTSTIE